MRTISTVCLLVLGPAALAVRGESPAAFDRRCIPPGCVAHRSNTAGILPLPALPGGRIAGLGATLDFHHGLLAHGSAQARQDDPIELRTVVGCLSRTADSWTLTRATEGEPTDRAFTSEDEIAGSRQQPLGSLTYRLLGIGEFGVDEHDGHKVQVKGLRLNIDGELRLNVTSFQHLEPACEP